MRLRELTPFPEKAPDFRPYDSNKIYTWGDSVNKKQKKSRYRMAEEKDVLLVAHVHHQKAFEKNVRLYLEGYVPDCLQDTILQYVPVSLSDSMPIIHSIGDAIHALKKKQCEIFEGCKHATSPGMPGCIQPLMNDPVGWRALVEELRYEVHANEDCLVPPDENVFFSHDACLALDAACSQYITQVLAGASRAAAIAGRVCILPRDLRIARLVDDRKDDRVFLSEHATKASSKRGMDSCDDDHAALPRGVKRQRLPHRARVS